MRSIRARLLVGTAIGVSLAFVISGVLVLVLARSSLYTQFDETLVARAAAVSELVEQGDDSVEIERDPASTVGERAYFELWDGERVLMRSPSLGAEDLERSPDPLSIRDVVLPDGSDGRKVTVRFPARREPWDHSTEPATMITLVLAQSVAEISAEVNRLTGVLIGVGLFGTLLCLAILIGVVRFGLAPVRSLAAAIAELREGDLAVEIEAASTPLELRPVVERLDELLRRLATAGARERDLTGEMAHELRTPIAGLRATIEVAMSRDDRPVERYRTALAECLAITRQMESLVATMLSLARHDAGTATVAQDPVDLDETLRESISAITARATERNVTIVPVLTPVTASTDRDMLQLVLHNLLDNAVSYVDDGGTIQVELAPGTIRISNTGCALAPAEIDRVFERFWRGDAARSGTHAGLGLALCKKLVRLLGGTITARVDDRKFIVVVTL